MEMDAYQGVMRCLFILADGGHVAGKSGEKITVRAGRTAETTTVAAVRDFIALASAKPAGAAIEAIEAARRLLAAAKMMEGGK